MIFCLTFTSPYLVLTKRELRACHPYDTLTRRERKVFQLASEGLSNLQIAEHLSLSVRTVEMHRGNLMKKLELKSQTDLVKYLVRLDMP